MADDRLREVLERHDNHDPIYPDDLGALVAAARRFLALTETGRIENLRQVVDNDECQWSDDGKYVTLPRAHHNVLWNFAEEFLADYLTEEE